MQIDDSTFYDRFKKEFNESFQDYSSKMHAVGSSNIKYMQYIKALDGNMNMLILLGREWLGQQQNDDSKQNSPIQEQIDYKHKIMLLEHENAELKRKIEDNTSNKPQTKSELFRGAPPF